jgi:hypothetical protein
LSREIPYAGNLSEGRTRQNEGDEENQRELHGGAGHGSV